MAVKGQSPDSLVLQPATMAFMVFLVCVFADHRSVEAGGPSLSLSKCQPVWDSGDLCQAKMAPIAVAQHHKNRPSL